MEQRSRLYDKMERDLDENGPAFLKHGGTTQSLSLSDIFTLKDGSVKPVHKVSIGANGRLRDISVASYLCSLKK